MLLCKPYIEIDMRLHPIATALLVTSLSTSVLIGCDKLSNSSPEELIERAKDHQAKGDLKASIIELKSALQKDPNNPRARWMLGETYIQYGLGAEAEKELKKAKELGVSSQTLMVPLAKSLLMQGEYKRLADEIVLLKTEGTPTNRAQLLQLQGEAQLGLGNLEQGCALFDESARADPQYVTAYIGQAKCAFAKKDINKTRALIAHAKSVDPNDVQSWLLEAELADQLGNTKAAHVAYSQALKTEPDNMAAITGHAYTALKLNDPASAKNDIDRAKKQFPDSIPVKYLEALMAYSQGKMSATRDKAQEILKLSPEHSSALLLLGLSSYKLGEYQSAQSNLNRVLVQQPGNTTVRKLLAELMMKSGEGKQAFILLRPALNQSSDPETLAIAANASAISGQLATARQLFNESLKKQPDQASVEVALARTLAASGEQEKALETLRLAAQHDTPDYQANKLLVQVLSQFRRYDEALRITQALQVKLPNKALPFNLEGTVYVAKGDLSSARKSFNQAITVEPTARASVLNLAQIDLAENKLKDARARLEEPINNLIKTPEALLLLATIARREGNEAGYVKSLKAALDTDPNSIAARIQLMSFYFEKNQTKTALALTKEGDQYGLKNPMYLDLKGKIQISAGEASGAVTTYQKLLQLAPNSAKTHMGMAMAQAAAGNLPAARSELATTLKLDPKNAEALSNMAILEASSGDITTARKHAGVLQSQHPKSPEGYALEGDMLLGQNKPGEAAKLYEKAFAIAPSGSTALSLFRAHYRSGNKPMAYEKMGLWLKGHPNDHRSRAYLAAAFKADGQYKEAIRHLEYILAKTPNNIAIQNDLALVYYALGDSRALSLAEKAYTRQPKSAQIADTYGWILLNQGQADKGLGIIRRAADMAPKDPSIRYHLAQALTKHGSRTEARLEVLAALQGGSSFPESKQAKQLLQELKP